MKRISKRVRAEAIEALLLEADTDGAARASSPLARALVDLALDAVWHATAYRLSLPADCLEAAALLRGDEEHMPWSPGDPVYLRSK